MSCDGARHGVICGCRTAGSRSRGTGVRDDDRFLFVTPIVLLVCAEHWLMDSCQMEPWRRVHGVSVAMAEVLFVAAMLLVLGRAMP